MFLVTSMPPSLMSLLAAIFRNNKRRLPGWKARSAWIFAFLLAGVFLLAAGSKSAAAESTMDCPKGTFDMLDWMTMDSGERSSRFMGGPSNPVFTAVMGDKFYWIKGLKGYPWDIQLYDKDYIYLWITESDWNEPTSFKKFLNNTNMPLTPRCAEAGFPGSTIHVDDTGYGTYSDCTHFTKHTLKKAINEVWGPYKYSFGGDLKHRTRTLVVSYRYNCDDSYNNCSDKEEFYLAKKYGLVTWTHYVLLDGKYQEQKKSVFNELGVGAVKPRFQCF
jgi:hypothetical protein